VPEGPKGHGAKRFKPAGYPKYQKGTCSVEYKTSGWKLLDPKHVRFTDKSGIGSLKLIGTWDLGFYQRKQIKRVRILRRMDTTSQTASLGRDAGLPGSTSRVGHTRIKGDIRTTQMCRIVAVSNNIIKECRFLSCLLVALHFLVESILTIGAKTSQEP